MSQEIVIEPRFRGPPESGNGGYSCGVLGEMFQSVATVTLRLPPPLDTPLSLTEGVEGVRLYHGEALVGEAAPDTITVDIPEPPGLDEARAASLGYAGFHEHPFPTCFVCGPEREPGDGLRIFPGPIGGLVAAPWEPDASLQVGPGQVGRRYVWSALDCPSYFGLPGRPMALLGRLTARIDRLPEVGEPLVAMGWPLRAEGRKHFAGSALADAHGEILAYALATWIELDPLPA
jgi:hypothetical protein